MGGFFVPCASLVDDDVAPSFAIAPTKQATLERLIHLAADLAEASGRSDAIGHAFQARSGFPAFGHGVPILEYAEVDHAEPGTEIDAAVHTIHLVTRPVVKSMSYLLQYFLRDVRFDIEEFDQAHANKQVGPSEWDGFITGPDGAGVLLLEVPSLKKFIYDVIDFLEGDGRNGFLQDV